MEKITQALKIMTVTSSGFRRICIDSCDIFPSNGLLVMCRIISIISLNVHYVYFSLFQYNFNDLSGSVSLAWVGDGTGVSCSKFKGLKCVV